MMQSITKFFETNKNLNAILWLYNSSTQRSEASIYRGVCDIAKFANKREKKQKFAVFPDKSLNF